MLYYPFEKLVNFGASVGNDFPQTRNILVMRHIIAARFVVVSHPDSRVKQLPDLRDGQFGA
jgi:hypothetical protein